MLTIHNDEDEDDDSKTTPIKSRCLALNQRIFYTYIYINVYMSIDSFFCGLSFDFYSSFQEIRRMSLLQVKLVVVIRVSEVLCRISICI